MPQNTKRTGPLREELNLGTCLPRLGWAGARGGRGLLDLVEHFAENIRLFNEGSRWNTCTSEPEKGDNSVRDHLFFFFFYKTRCLGLYEGLRVHVMGRRGTDWWCIRNQYGTVSHLVTDSVFGFISRELILTNGQIWGEPKWGIL